MAKHITDRGLGICAIIISIISFGVGVGFSIKQCSFENKLHKLHLDPSLEYFLIRSPNSDILGFFIKNTSPIPVVNLSIVHKYCLFSDKLKKYFAEMPSITSILDSPGQWFFKKKLEPNERVGKKESQILSALNFYNTSSKTIITAIFEITYYRESDMKQFNNKAIFFLDGEKIYSYKNALKEEFLKEPIEQLPIWEEKVKSSRKVIESRESGDKLFQKSE